MNGLLSIESLRDTFSEACFVLVDSVDPMPRSLLRGSSLPELSNFASPPAKLGAYPFSYVIDGYVADLLVVAGRVPGTVGGDGLALFTVSADASGVERRFLESMDATRKLARIDFHGVHAQLLGNVNDGNNALVRTLDQAAVALANEMVGGSQVLLDSAVNYAKLRVQFGRTIGSFQAIKHKCADMLLDVELAKSAAYYAAQAAVVDDPEWPALACLAKASASEIYLRIAVDCIQIHGGIGFTWDNDTHLWFKRAKSSKVFLGQPNYHRELLLQRWGV